MASVCTTVLRRAHVSQLYKPLGNVCRCLQRQYCQQAESPRWQLYSAICLERYPIITPPLTPLEEKYQQMAAQLELEGSLLSNHELEHKDDLDRAERMKKMSPEELKEERKKEAVKTVQDLQDMWDKELKAFKPASRITDADKSDDRTSLHRKLDRKLILIVKQKLAEDQYHWTLPMGIHEEPETMREAAERILETHCGSDIQCKFLGNAPCGFFKFKIRTSNVENKVFFFKAMHNKGNISQISGDVRDYKWVTKDELKEYLDSRYLKTVKKFVLEF